MTTLRSHTKTPILLLFIAGGTLAMTALMGLILWAITPGLEFAPLALLALGSVSCAILGTLQLTAMPALLPRRWVAATAIAGAIGVPLSSSFAVPLLFVVGQFAVAIAGLALGLAIGIAQFIVLRKRYVNTWPWIPINSAALGAGFLLAFPATTSLNLQFYPPFSPGWTAVGAIAGLVYGTITAFVAVNSQLAELRPTTGAGNLPPA